MLISGMESAGRMQDRMPSMDTQSIDQKIQKLRQQLKKIKENDKLLPQEKENKIRQIEEKIKKLEEQKQKLKQKEGQEKSAAESPGDKSPSRLSSDEAMGNYIDAIV